MFSLRDLRRLLWIPIGLGLAMAIVAWPLDGAFYSAAFLTMSALGGALYTALWMLTRRQPDDAKSSLGYRYSTVAIAWLVVPLLGALPLWVLGEWLPDTSAGVFAKPMHAIFESFSGWTSTGLSMIASPEDQPRSILIWRTVSEWFGGLGIAVVMLLFMNPALDGGDLAGAEISADLADTPRKTALAILAIYAVLSVLAVLSLAATEMTGWAALNHGLTAVSTGGFSVTNQSLADYSLPTQLLTAFWMLAGAVSFGWYWLLAKRQFKGERGEYRPILVLLLSIVVASVVLWLSQRHFDANRGFGLALFQVISAFSTGGFSTASLADWHSAPLMILVTCMIIGGCSGSTAGGIKVDRVWLIGRGIRWRLNRLFGQVEESTDVAIDGERMAIGQARLQVESAATLIGLWLFTLLLGCLLLAPLVGDEWQFTQVLFEAASAQSGVGLSVGITSASLDDRAKAILITLMWAGRLELIAGLALLSSVISSRYRAAGPHGKSEIGGHQPRD